MFYNRSKIMCDAWTRFKNKPGSKFSTCLKIVWYNATKAMQLLQQGYEKSKSNDDCYDLADFNEKTGAGYVAVQFDMDAAHAEAIAYAKNKTALIYETLQDYRDAAKNPFAYTPKLRDYGLEYANLQTYLPSKDARRLKQNKFVCDALMSAQAYMLKINRELEAN